LDHNHTLDRVLTTTSEYLYHAAGHFVKALAKMGFTTNCLMHQWPKYERQLETTREFRFVNYSVLLAQGVSSILFV
jgi:type IV secretory pathway VirB6-like protein